MPVSEKNLYEKNKHLNHYKTFKHIPKNVSSWDRVKWILKESGLPTLKLNIFVPYEDILSEENQNKHLYVKHRGINSPGWKSMAIHGTAIEDTQPKEYYIEKGKYTKETCPNYGWTKLADKCPKTKIWLENLGFKYFERVRFMVLEPGGWIASHADTNNRGIQAWNVSITNPKGHVFCMDNYGYVPWEVGEMRGIDIGITHAVVNTSSEPRVHMIIHGNFGEKFCNTIITSYQKFYEKN